MIQFSAGGILREFRRFGESELPGTARRRAFYWLRRHSFGIENHPATRHILSMTKSNFAGPVYVVRDNIDTDQIISAQYLNLVPTIPEEYEKLGSYALAGLPESLYT